jgi:putative adhesin
MRRFALASTLVFACPFLQGCVATLDSQSEIVREQKQFTVKGAPSVHVATFDGTIEIQSWDKPEVMVEIEKRGPTRESINELQIKSSQDGDAVTVEVPKPTGAFHVVGFHQSLSARLTVWLPRRSDVTARSGDGSLSIQHVNGRIDLHTGDGTIRATGIEGDLSLTTGDGSVAAEDARGRLVVDTGDGAVNVTGSASSVRLHSGDGSIVYRALDGTEMSDDWEITTGDGAVLIYLPPGLGAELDAHTGDGGIRNDLNVTTGSAGEISRRTVRGRLGEGGRRIRIRTGDGSITLRRL